MDEKRLVDGTTALAEKQPRVIKIEPTERPQNVRLRVAAYTRVSSDSEDQLNSFAAQNRYYTELISSKAEWRMVDIYADEGITGTSVAKRDDFQRMMADCRRGLIDQILVKSISRFARNTKDCLQNIRELKELGVNVRFEREGIDTVNVSSELITAIYAAFAQKESESISGNMQWSYQRRMESGEFNTCKAPWGFRLDGRKLKICEPEADIVQRIFREYLSGKNPQEIADDLNASCLTERVWNYKAVDYILQNERYAGNALLQKRYTPDMLSRQQKTNHGEREMYFVPGSNDAIISPEIFKRAQGLRQKRSLGKAPVHSEIISQIRCICGARMRFKNVNSKWYLCCTSHDTKGDCLITPIRETQIHASFCRLYYKLKHQSIPILEQMLTSLQLIRNRRMKRILFICHGNICRSPMAEFVMKDLVKKAGLASQFHIESAATSREEIGNTVYPPARRKLAEHGISCEGHAARQLTNRDYDEYDLLIGMDQANLRDMYRICGGDYVGKMSLLMDHTAHPGNVADPWYTEDFEATWQDVLDGCQGLLKEFMTERGDSNGTKR